MDVSETAASGPQQNSPRVVSFAATTATTAAAAAPPPRRGQQEGNDEHTYTLCLLGYSQSFSQSPAGTIRELPVQLDGAITQVSCGLDWIVLLTEHGRLYSFGSNTYGQLAQGHQLATPRPKPIAFPTERHITRVSCGSSHGAFLLDTGALFTFGCGTYGRLGTGTETSSAVPVAVRMTWAELHAKAEALGQVDSAVIPGGRLTTTIPSIQSTASGDANALGSRWDGDEEVIFTDVSCGDRHTLVLGARPTGPPGSGKSTPSKNQIIAFGDGMNGRLGLGSEQDQPTGALVVQVKSMITSYVPSFVAICAGHSHNAAVTSAGELFTWGNGADGQLGHQAHESEWTPREVQFFRGISLASARCGVRHTVAVSRSGAVYAWGRGAEGQLGTGSTGSVAGPQRVALAVDPVILQQMQIEAQLASSQPASPSATASLVALQDTRVLVRAVVAKENMTMAMDEQSRLYMWGDNSCGQLGLPMASEPRPDAERLAVVLSRPIAARVLNPRQLSYMDLREEKTAPSRVSTFRDRMQFVAASRPRVGLTHIDASDRFSLLVFKTKAPVRSVNGDGLESQTSKNSLLGATGRGTTRSFLRDRPSLFGEPRASSTTTWQLTLTDDLQTNDIPSRESEYYNYMANYKVHIRPPSPVRSDDGSDRECEDGDGGREGTKRTRRLSCKARGRSASALSTMTSQNQQDESASDFRRCDAEEGLMKSLSPDKSMTSERVRGYETWLLTHRMDSPGSMKYQFGTAARFRERRDSRECRPETVATAPTLSGCRMTVPRPNPPTTFTANKRPTKPKSAFGRSVHPRSSTTPIPRRENIAAHSPLKPPSTITKSSRLPEKEDSSRPVEYSELELQRQYRQHIAPFGSSVASRFGLAHRPASTYEAALFPEKCEVIFPRSPGARISNAEHFSEIIGRRLQQGKGGNPGPGAYDRHGG